MDIGSHGNKIIERGFFRDDDLDFATRGLLGRAVHGAREVGEVLSTIARVGKHDDWATAWTTTAERVEAEAERSRDGGHAVSAASGFLRAATYWACVVDGLSTEEDADALLAAFRSHRRAWDAFVACSGGAHVAVAVPYESDTLPGWLLRPDASGQRRPTLVITNGSDGAISDLWTSAAAGALARGWNAFVYDGPGQQSMLFERQTFFRPDWEAVLTPIIDALLARDDVAADQLTGYGISQAGYWLPRALAFEHRLRAAVADPGVVDVSTSWTRSLTKGMRTLLADGQGDKFDQQMRLATLIPGLRRTLAFRGRPYEQTDYFDLDRSVGRYRLTPELAAQVTTPLLITDPEHEQFWPGQSDQLAALLPGRTELVAFTAAEGADHHCQPLGRLLTENRMFDWLEARVT